MIIGIVGNIRTGKTLLLTMLGYLMKKSGYEVYSNYNTTFSKFISVLDILDFNIDNGVLLLDEIGTIIDARNNSSGNRLFSYFINQSGKRDVHVIYTSQSRILYDLRLDMLTHIMIKVEKNETGHKYKISKNIDGTLVEYTTKKLSFEDAKNFYGMYDTKEIIYAPELSGLNLMDFKEVQEIFNNSNTKKSFAVLLRKKNPYISVDTGGAVYDYLKNGQVDLAKQVLGSK